jgi:glutaryl-CoA dehydrogenase (non-decarboxylating)
VKLSAAFSLTEPNAGSAIQNLETTFSKQGDKYILNGCKKWTSYGEKADLFLIFGKDEEKSIACLLTKEYSRIRN